MANRYFRSIPVFMLILSFALTANIGYSYRSQQSPVATTVLIVRHAEKSSTPPDDPPLTEAGITRAKSLVQILGKAGVKAIYATQYARTQQTVKPLADHLGLTVNKIEAGNIKDLVDQILSKHAGETVFVSGHSNSLPQFIKALGGSEIAPLGDMEYDNLYIVTVYAPGKANVLNLK